MYHTSRQQASWSLDELPRNVALSLHQGSNVTSMDFSPSHHTLLLGMLFCHLVWENGDIFFLYCFIFCRNKMAICLFTTCIPIKENYHSNLYSYWAVGCHNGEISLWELGMREKLVVKPFKIWDISACSLAFQVFHLHLLYLFLLCLSWPGCHFLMSYFVMLSSTHHYMRRSTALLVVLLTTSICVYISFWSKHVGQETYSLDFIQAATIKDAPISVSRVTWSQDGNFVGKYA